jgi:misacylated tRNA(Ala) deacylase
MTSSREWAIELSMKEYTEPRMHTAEHILNQTMVRMFGCGRSFSSHIEKKKSKCDYRFARNLTPEEIAEIEARVNEVIRSDLPVWEEQLSREKAAGLSSLERLPETAGDTLRIVHVGDYDACPCSGQHAASSKEIGAFKIASTSFESGVLRVRFKITLP